MAKGFGRRCLVDDLDGAGPGEGSDERRGSNWGAGVGLHGAQGVAEDSHARYVTVMVAGRLGAGVTPC